jgi:UPF0755 protein
LRKGCLAAAGGGAVALLVVGYFGLVNSTAPLPPGQPMFVRYESGTSLDGVLTDLREKGIIRNAGAAKIMIRLKGLPSTVKSGSFEVKPGMDLGEVMRTLQKPIRRMVRLPEGWWIARTAAKLEEEDVCKASEYLALAADPSKFKEEFSFVPEKSLEGYLYPDTYDLPPLLSAKDVIRMQLKAFKSKIIDELKPNQAKLHRAVIIGSIIENEAALDEERPRIAGVIENRLRIGQRLEMDATVLYGIQDWRVLKQGEVRKLASPYNTYLHAGLPPGPIGAPNAKSVEAALRPEAHNLIYYVARPNRSHYFSSAYADHLASINKARQEWKEAKP